MKLKNKKVLVTAAGQGIGLATVKKYAEEGAIVYAVDINKDLLDKISSIEGVTPICADLTDATACDTIMSGIDTVDVLLIAQAL